MPRLIDADALFEPDENSDKVLIVGGQRSGGKTIALAMELLKQKVEAAPTIDPAPQWIPVTERLPEERVEVLVWSRCGFHETAVYLGIPGKWRITWNHDLLEEGTVTHWMPLPKPPEDGGADV